ncbi:MAG: antitoxin family protein [Planctomycetes bacterium]|nr:antitoxin family protein [Planctomycetota bacterium]
MQKTIKAKYRHGVLEPLSDLQLEEGEEVTLTIESEENHTEGNWSSISAAIEKESASLKLPGKNLEVILDELRDFKETR